MDTDLLPFSNVDIWIICYYTHDDVIKWKHFPRYWPFVRGIHRSPVISPHKGEWRGALMLSLICVWINGWLNNHKAGDLWRHRAHYDATVLHNLDGVFMVVAYINGLVQDCSNPTQLAVLHWAINIMLPIHSAISSNELSDLYTTQTIASEVR